MTEEFGYCVEQRLRDQLPFTDMQLMVQLDRLELRPYQYDLGPNNEVLLRLSYELLKQLVELHEHGLENVIVEKQYAPGFAQGRRGHVLCG